MGWCISLGNSSFLSATILMTTYNGEKFLAEQLDSLADQTFTNWRLIVSDDGSTDGTLSILKKYQTLLGKDKLVIRSGPQKGFAQNFLSLACDESIKSDFYAFCDQDDVWMPEKLQVAIDHIHSSGSSQQVYAYGGRTIYVDEKLKPLGYSPLFVFPRTFRNALIQNIAGGNTMVFSQATKNLLEKSGVVPTIAHDWWLYQLVTAAGGFFFYDPKPLIYYRQHVDSVIGSNQSLKSHISRLYLLINGRYSDLINQNLKCLSDNTDLFTSESIEILSTFKKLRKAKLRDRIRLIQVCGLYRQTLRGTISLHFFTVLNRL